MTWNYRVVRTELRGIDVAEYEYSYDVCEVYYEDSKPVAYTLEKNVLSQDSLEDLKTCYEKIAKAFEKPVIEDINGELVELSLDEANKPPHPLHP